MSVTSTILVGDHRMETHVCIGHGLGRETLAKPVPDRSTRACALRIMILAVDMMLNKQQGMCIVGPGPSCLLLLGQAATMHQMTHFPVPTGRHGRSLLRPQSLGQVPTVILCQEWNCPAAWQASLPILGFPMTLVYGPSANNTMALESNRAPQTSVGLLLLLLESPTL